MYTLTTAASKFSALKTAALASAFACLALTGCATPPPSDGSAPPPTPTRPLPPAQLVSSLSDYVSWLTLQGAAELDTERTRLQSLPDSADRNLRLALLYGTRGSAAFNPQLAAQLLIQVAAGEPQGSAYSQLAHLLFASQPDPATYTETERLSALSNGLTAQLNEQHTRSQGLETQLEVTRKELETERNERARLENQLKALKSLEAQIKGRDEVSH